MEQLLSMIALWLSVNFGLPAHGQLPRIEFHDRAAITQLWAEHISRKQDMTSRALKVETSELKIQAFYDDREQTIFLREDWNPTSQKDLSILVHEMVHHLQKLDKRAFNCPAEREKLAYKAQDAWLGLFQTSLENEFEIDPFTRLVSTKCMH